MFYIFISYSRIDQMPIALMHTQVSNLTFRDCFAQCTMMNRKICHYAPGSYRPTCDFHFPAVFITDEHAKTATHFFLNQCTPPKCQGCPFPHKSLSEMGLNSESLLQSCPYNSQVTSAVFCEPKSSQWRLSRQSQLVT